ncbi:MAG: ribosome-binding factor A [Candidatus Omnitrophota bacterium]|jgi:ribosome-binding factor A
MSRMDKINQQVKREVGKIVSQDMADPRVAFASITNVKVSPDLSNAKVYFSVLGGEGNVDGAQHALNAARGMVRHLVAKRMQLRRVPDFTFHYDDSIMASVRIEETIKEIKDDLQKDSSDNQEA